MQCLKLSLCKVEGRGKCLISWSYIVGMLVIAKKCAKLHWKATNLACKKIIGKFILEGASQIQFQLACLTSCNKCQALDTIGLRLKIALLTTASWKLSYCNQFLLFLKFIRLFVSSLLPWVCIWCYAASLSKLQLCLDPLSIDIISKWVSTQSWNTKL